MSYTDMDGAIAALTTALESMEKRVTALDDEILAATRNRRQQLDQRVELLLPDFAPRTYDKLLEEVPSFASSLSIKTAFTTYKRNLWIFKTAGYDGALAFVKTQLKSFLEINPDSTTTLSPLQALQDAKALFGEQQMKALELLKSLESTKKNGSPISAAMQVNINRIADKGRAISATSSSQVRPYATGADGARKIRWSRPGNGSAHAVSPSASSEWDNHTDLWLWMMMDIPTSARTLMLSSFKWLQHDETTSPSGLVMSSLNSSADDGSSRTLASSPIATDDSLGAYS